MQQQQQLKKEQVQQKQLQQKQGEAHVAYTIQATRLLGGGWLTAMPQVL
jgi:hypothetical protein